MDAWSPRRLSLAALACIATGAAALYWHGGEFAPTRAGGASSAAPGMAQPANGRSARYAAATLDNVPPAYALARSSAIALNAESVAAGDFNGDGRTDLAVLAVADNNDLRVQLLVQDGAGVLAASSIFHYHAGIGGGGNANIVAGDFNEDGRTDLVVTHPAFFGFRYLLSEPGGSFTWREEDWSDLVPIGPPQVADVDNDGHLDVVLPLWLAQLPPTRAHEGQYAVSFGDGAGSFFRHSWTLGAPRRSIALGRVNADPYPDLLASGSGYGDLEAPSPTLWRNLGGSGWSPPSAVSPLGPIVGAVIADLTGEGRSDAVLLQKAGFPARLLVYPQLADGTLAAEPAKYFAAHDLPAQLVERDLDGNGRRDLLQLDRLGLHYYLQDEFGLGYPRQVDLDAGDFGYPLGALGLALGDFDHDGILDIAVAAGGNGVIIASGQLVPYIGPGGLPGAPSVTQVQDWGHPNQVEPRSVMVTVAPPLDNGGSAITSYSVYSLPGGAKDMTEGGLPITTRKLIGLDPNVAYVFYARANNAAGMGPPSAPSAPLTLLAGKARVGVELVSASEGDFGSVTHEIRLRAETPAHGASVRVSTSDGSAVAGSDYLASSQVVHFPDGALVSDPFLLTVLADLQAENDETVNLLVSEAQGAELEFQSWPMTITNDDVAGATLRFGDAQAVETDQGSAVVNIPFGLNAAQPGVVSFDVELAPWSDATNGSDYAPPAVSWSLLPGQTEGQIQVSIHGDTVYENVERISVYVSNLQGAQFAGAGATLYIIDNDPPPTLSVDDTAAMEGDEGVSVARFKARLSAPSPHDVLFAAAAVEGSAKAGSDFISHYQGSVVIPAGAMETDIVVPLVPDRQRELDETFTLRIENTSGHAITDGEASATIVNDDLPNRLSVNDASVSEGGIAQFTIVLTEPSAQAVTFDAFTSNGTATSGIDFQSAQFNNLVIPAGTTSISVEVATIEDALVEGDETLMLNLASVQGAVVGDGQGQGRIVNDDLAVLSIGDVSISEGNAGVTSAYFEVRLSRPMPVPVHFGIATVPGGTALGGNLGPADHESRYTWLTLDAGRTVMRFEVRVHGDVAAEADETFFVKITQAVNATLGDDAGVGVIVNDDAP